MHRFIHAAGALLGTLRTIAKSGLGSVAYFAERPWLALLVDLSLKHLTGKDSSEWIMSGWDMLQAQLTGLLGEEDADKARQLVNRLMKSPAFEDVIGRYAADIDFEVGVSREDEYKKELTSPIPRDLPIWEWAASISKRFGKPLRSVIRERAAAFGVG